MFEGIQLFLRAPQASGAALFLFLAATDLDVPLKLLSALENSEVRITLDLVLGEFNRAERSEVLGIVRDDDQLFNRDARRQLDLALFPDEGDVVPPALEHALDIRVRSAQEKNLGTKRVASCQHGKVLDNDRFEQAGHQLVGWHTLFLQTVDIGLGEDATLAGNGMELEAVIRHSAQVLRSDLELGVDLVEHGTGAAGAFIIHRRDFLLLAGLLIFLEDDDLGILATQLNHAANVGIELLDGEGDRVNLLHELGAEVPANATAAGTGHENAERVRLQPGEGRLDAFEELQAFFRLLGIVPLVILPQDLVGDRIDNDRLDGGRADVQANDR